MPRLNRTGVPLLLARFVLGGVFIYFGWLKLADPLEFLKHLHFYDILPERPPWLLNSVALVLPWLEVACGVALILGIWLRGSALMLGGMLVTFMVALYLRALSIAQTDGLPFCTVKFDCGCGTGVRIICHKLLENAGLLLLCIMILFSRRRLFCLSSILGGERFLPLLAADRCPHCGQVMMHDKPPAAPRSENAPLTAANRGADVPEST
jgi:uncharacterized membrane protein YphA (DoxX/SURF4 family)